MSNDITIPDHELDITTSRAGGPGGQHVNKTSTRITIRWNVKTTSVLDAEQKERVLQKLHTRLTSEGELIIHNSESRSQQHNKKLALTQLHAIVRKALHVPKKRMKSRIPHGVQESRLEQKAHRSSIKKMRTKKISYE
jgi:ribosome-associated protein